jgi:hypothetical protein
VAGSREPAKLPSKGASKGIMRLLRAPVPAL